MNWKKLQNGSDIRGVALDGIEGEKVNLTADVVTVLGKSFASWLRRKNTGKIKVAVGTDSRLSGPILEKAFIEGLKFMGTEVYQCGLSSTPAMFMTTKDPKIDATGGVMLTASHLPFNRNGLKFFTKSGGVDKNDIIEILEIAERGDFQEINKEGNVQSINFIDRYSEFLIDYIRKSTNKKENYHYPLGGLKIIVDAGNGAGGFFAEKVLKSLGADIEGSQFLEPDGRFPNHIPNPENEEAMDSVCQAVKNSQADLGIIFDTDVDRAAIVTDEGNPVNRNDLIAMISAVVLKEHPGSTVVTDSITSEGLTKFIEEHLHGKHHRFKRGYKNVINEAKRLNEENEESWLAIETSGHAALKENFFLDDGAYLVAKLLVEMAKLKAQGKNLKDLIIDLKRPVESKEFRLSIIDDEFKNYGNQVINELTKKVREMPGWEIVSPNYEGLRVSCKNENESGWFLLRLSLHDPVMPVNIESDVKGGLKNIADKLYAQLTPFDKLDHSPLAKRSNLI
ncbi:MAG: phosphomannomutase/phosphoglucomutase [Bacteroidota bacterium]